MKAPVSKLTNKIISNGEGYKLRKEKFEFEGKRYIITNAPSYTEIEERKNEESR